MAERKKFKEYFDGELALLLAEKIHPVYPKLDRGGFVRKIKVSITARALKERVAIFADILHEHLPDDYPAAVKILHSILGPENEAETGMFTNWYWLMPVAFYVEHYGLEHFEQSIFAIEEITKRHTGEYAVRPFIRRYPQEMIGRMTQWSESNCFHLRRLASEGLRPRLPWSRKLDLFIDDPAPVMPILENLKSDPVRFVRKSVGNHLNDLLKDNYPAAMKTIRRWRKNASDETRWIIKHALRNELKKGNPEARKMVEG